MKRLLLSLCVLGIVFSGACNVDTAPAPLRRTPAGDGPRVKFDTSHRPLPDVPLPNDVATFPDPTSRTGRRINVSQFAPTKIEQVAREAFNSMEGWGVSSPITVAFDRGTGIDELTPAIDLDDVMQRMQGDENDPSNDPVYLVNLTTGVPMFLDAGGGYFPVVLQQPMRYFPNDEKAGESNLSFETVEEGAGLPQSAYRPELDRDFDGVLDHPNTLGTKGIFGVDNLLTWYERETDTLIVRPLLPLEEKTEYAVILTDRLRDGKGRAVRSPFDGVYHPSQRRGAEQVAALLGDKRRANYFGDIAGTGLDHVAFAWTFTTQPTHEDMRILRDGLYGTGPFARWKDEYPTEVTIKQPTGTAPYPEPQPDGWQSSSAACGRRAKTPYVLKLSGDDNADVRDAFHSLYRDVFTLNPGDLAAQEASTAYIDHIVVGSFKSPYLLGDPASRDIETRFHVNFQTGEGDIRPDDVDFFIVVPKTSPAHQQPFPVAFWGHGVGGNSTEELFYAGDYARQGIAMVGINEPGHGLSLSEADRRLADAILLNNCLVPFVSGLAPGRAADMNGDGVPDSGWFWWTSHIFHTRDMVRQGTLDAMQLTRVLHAFDGRRSKQDFNGDGKPDLAGDFDGDGRPDIGGPTVQYFAAGESLGGIMSEIHGGIDPYLTATAPMSGGGSLALDVGFRSYGVVEAVMGQIMGPFVIAVPASERPNKGDKDAREMLGSVCSPTQRSVRLQVNEGDNNHELEFACLNPDELAENVTVIVTNVTTGEERCARTSADGRLRIPVPMTTGDKLDVQVYNAPDVVESYDGCKLQKGVEHFAGRRINTVEKPAPRLYPVGNADTNKCDAPEGCQQFRDSFYPVGSPLVAINDGYGLRRQSPALRRFRDLAQMAYDPADPIVYAPYYMLKPLVDENGKAVPPRALLSINTVGDNFVEIAAGYSFARAAGALPFLPPTAIDRFPEYADYATPTEIYDKLGRRTPMQFLIDKHVIEGVARLNRTGGAGPKCAPNYVPGGATCPKNPVEEPYECRNALFDADWASEGRMPFDQPHAEIPLRLARMANVHAADTTSLAASWGPRLRGEPFSPDSAGWSAHDRIVGVFSHYLTAKGQHTWDVGDKCKVWDFAPYGNALTARFFASGGRDLYYLSHPTTHGCLVDATCDFFADGPSSK